MKNQIRLMPVFLTFFVASSSLYTDENRTMAENIARRAYTSIAQIEEGKIFLKPEKLCLNQGIIYVEDIDGKGLPISAVFPSDGRPYMEVGDIFVFNSWKCECGAWNHKWDNPTRCWRCDRPR